MLFKHKWIKTHLRRFVIKKEASNSLFPAFLMGELSSDPAPAAWCGRLHVDAMVGKKHVDRVNNKIVFFASKAPRLFHSCLVRIISLL
jgi:hypothetical protein